MSGRLSSFAGNPNTALKRTGLGLLSSALPTPPRNPQTAGKADKEDRVETETTEPIADEHADVRRRFVELWNERTSGDAGDLATAWRPVATLLENHASSQADAVDPALPEEAVARRPRRALVRSEPEATRGTI